MELFELLKEERQRRGWSIGHMALECGSSQGLVSKWLAEDERFRVTPGPKSCEKIADALGYDHDYILELAGHRKPREGQERDEELLRMAQEMRAALEDRYPRPFWGIALKASLDLIRSAPVVDIHTRQEITDSMPIEAPTDGPGLNAPGRRRDNTSKPTAKRSGGRARGDLEVQELVAA